MHECQTGFDKNTSLLISFFPYLKEILVYYGDRNIINVMREREREQSYEMDEKLMKELAAFIDLADGNESEEKSEQFLEFRLQAETKKNTVSVKY